MSDIEYVTQDNDQNRFTVFYRGERIGQVYVHETDDPERPFFLMTGDGRMWTHDRTDNFFVTRDLAAEHLVAVTQDDPYLVPVELPKIEVKYKVVVGAFGSCRTFDSEIEALRWIASHSPYRIEKATEVDLTGAITSAIRKNA